MYEVLPSVVRYCDSSDCYGLAPDEETQAAHRHHGREDHHSPQDPNTRQVKVTNQPPSEYRSTSSPRYSHYTYNIDPPSAPVESQHLYFVKMCTQPQYLQPASAGWGKVLFSQASVCPHPWGYPQLR